MAVVAGADNKAAKEKKGSEGSKTKTDCECACEREAVLLRDIKELDFIKGAYTVSRRVAGIPQLECVGGSAKGASEPNLVRCVNNGISEAKWRCEATMDKEVQLGAVTVTCEGYSGQNDPYVLRGSCGLQYNLEYTHYGAYFWGKFMRVLYVLIVTPLKWLVTLAAVLFAGLVVLAAIRRPTRRHGNSRGNSSDTPNPIAWLQKAADKAQNAVKSATSKNEDSDDEDDSDAESGDEDDEEEDEESYNESNSDGSEDEDDEEEEEEEPRKKSNVKSRNGRKKSDSSPEY